MTFAEVGVRFSSRYHHDFGPFSCVEWPKSRTNLGGPGRCFLQIPEILNFVR